MKGTGKCTQNVMGILHPLGLNEMHSENETVLASV